MISSRICCLLKDPDSIGDAERAERRLFVMRFQQLTGPVMAKGLEDTAFYRYCPLLSLNEVGGSPETFGVPLAHFHGKNSARRTSWRNAMLASSTHDTKRSEDVRARINVLSEIPAEWYRAIRAWQLLNQDKKIQVAGEFVPSANEEYFLYQTLIGAWPLAPMNSEEHREFVGRIHGYMEKALREAKVNTSWVSPNTEYEAAFHSFLDALLDRSISKAFFDDFVPFQARIATAGIFNSLSQTLLKITSPGLPDFYQGTEVWNFSLADPDNRRAVDYHRLQTLLARLRAAESDNPAPLVDRLVAEPTDGSLKLFITRSALCFRRDNRALFAKGSYLPLRASGDRNKHLIAFARSFRDTTVVMLAGRFFAQLEAQTRLPVGLEALGKHGNHRAKATSRRVVSRPVYRSNYHSCQAQWHLDSPRRRCFCTPADCITDQFRIKRQVSARGCHRGCFQWRIRIHWQTPPTALEASIRSQRPVRWSGAIPRLGSEDQKARSAAPG